MLAADRPFMLKEVTIHPPKATVPTLAMACASLLPVFLPPAFVSKPIIIIISHVRYNAPAGLGLLWTMLDSIDLRTQQLAPYRVFDNMEQSAFNDWKTNNPSSSDRTPSLLLPLYDDLVGHSIVRCRASFHVVDEPIDATDDQDDRRRSIHSH